MFALADILKGGLSPSSASKSANKRTYLRPPGALPEKEFLEVCTRCDECVKACPHLAIRKAGHDQGALFGTPIIVPKEAACRLCKDLACIPVCEPGALKPVAREDVRMGLAKIHSESCYAFQSQPCDYCVTKCPIKRDAISLDDQRRPVVHAEGCTGCGVCVEWCPTDAVEIIV